jgi:beta-galactosidase/beta-glucuronidase
VWINGKYVGYHEDSKTPAEFNISGIQVADYPEQQPTTGMLAH